MIILHFIRLLFGYSFKFSQKEHAKKHEYGGRVRRPDNKNSFCRVADKWKWNLWQSIDHIEEDYLLQHLKFCLKTPTNITIYYNPKTADIISASVMSDVIRSICQTCFSSCVLFVKCCNISNFNTNQLWMYQGILKLNR